MVVIRLLGSVLTGSVLRKARSPAEIPAAALERAGRLVRSEMEPNLEGLMEERSWRAPKAGTESWVTGSLNRKLGMMLFSTPKMPLVTLPRPFPPGTAMFLAMDPTKKARSGETPEKPLILYR